MSQHVTLSFSGGKDSCFALYKLYEQDITVTSLVTTIWSENLQTVAHEQTKEKLIQQANALGLPVEFVVTTFSTYKNDFVNQLKYMKEKYGINGIAFGDMYLEGHREWGEKLAEDVDLQPLYPLWTKKKHMVSMLQQFIQLNFQAKVIKIDEEKLPASWVGRWLDESFIQDIQTYENVCPMGESGEYHTHVYGGPVFNNG